MIKYVECSEIILLINSVPNVLSNLKVNIIYYYEEKNPLFYLQSHKSNVQYHRRNENITFDKGNVITGVGFKEKFLLVYCIVLHRNSCGVNVSYTTEFTVSRY